MLPKILRGHSDYVNIKVADADGSLFCTAAPVDPRLFPHIRDGVWFERAKRARATAVGDYQISATSGQPAIVVAHPLLDSSGGVGRVIAAIVSLDQLNKIVADAVLPDGATIVLFHRNRTILARFPDSHLWMGQQVPDGGPLARLTAGATEDVTETVGVDGVPRLYVTVPVRASIDTGLYLAMGIERARAFRDAGASTGCSGSSRWPVSAPPRSQAGCSCSDRRRR